MDVQLAAESPHGDLKRLGPAVRLQAEHFAIQD
jgi:hypothetical protein